MNTDATAAAVLAAGACSPQCLLAAGREASTCACPCGGTFHAALIGATVVGSAGIRPPPALPHVGPTLLDLVDEQEATDGDLTRELTPTA